MSSKTLAQTLTLEILHTKYVTDPFLNTHTKKKKHIHTHGHGHIS